MTLLLHPKKSFIKYLWEKKEEAWVTTTDTRNLHLLPGLMKTASIRIGKLMQKLSHLP